MAEPPVEAVAPPEPQAAVPVAGDGAEMSVLDHLEELRWRIFKSIAAVLAAAIAVFIFNGEVIHVLELPLTASTNPFGGPPVRVELIFTSPGEYFMAAIKIALLGGLYLALPVVLFQVLAFIGPGLLPGERRWAVPTVIGAFGFFSLGMLFAYFFMLPAGLQFLVGFAPSDVKPLLSVGKYLGFAAGMVFATGLAFELPLFLLAASVMGVVTSYSLAEQRRSAFFAAFVLAAILTPSVDVFSQVLMAGALYGLFELSIFMIRLTGR